jgi:Tol biopolymer transport system component
VSVNLNRHDPHGASFYPVVSGDGRYVAFESDAPDLVADDTNGKIDVFRRDLRTGTTVRVSVDQGGGDANKQSSWPAISFDGKYVAFHSEASDLVPDDGNGKTDVFVRDTVAGTTLRVSVDVDGGDADGFSSYPNITPDGRYVVFASNARDIVAGDGNIVYDVFRRDLQTGTTVRASVDVSDVDPDGNSFFPEVSANGRYVAFFSDATDLVVGDGNSARDVFRRDLLTGMTERVDVDLSGGELEEGADGGNMSADGRYVDFNTVASDVVPGDGNGFYDGFVRDMVTGTTVRASLDKGGGDPEDDVFISALTPDGRFALLFAHADDLVQGDHKNQDLFVRDLVLLSTTRVTVSLAGGDPNGQSFGRSISDSGRYVTYQSDAANLVRDDHNDLQDIFLRDMTRPATPA